MTDNDLVRLLHDAVPEPPVVLLADPILHAARRRVQRRWTGVGGAVMLALIVGIAIARHTGSANESLVGSTPAPAPVAAVPACATGQLRALASGGGVISNGFTGATITLTNTGTTACHLDERIVSLRSDKANADLPITPTASDHGGPQDLGPGATVAFTIASERVSGGSGNCLRPAPSQLASPPVLGFRFPNTQEVTVSLPGGVFTLGCWPIVVSRLFVAEPVSTASPAPVVTGAFLPTDVSFVSPTRGWAISPGHLLETADGGRSWSTLPAPPENADHVRFANTTVGYAWSLGKDLFITRDSGLSWQPAKLTFVWQVEAASGAVWALAGAQPYPGVWRAPMGAPFFTRLGQTPDRSGTLDVHGDMAYVVGVQGAGPIAGSIDVWTPTGRTNRQLPCSGHDLYVPFSPLGVSTNGDLFLVCNLEAPATTNGAHQLAYLSTDHGLTWTRTTAPTQAPDDVAATQLARFAWGANLERYDRDGTRWTTVIDGAGFATVGFQDDLHGLALTRNGKLYLTHDAGLSWRATTFPTG